MRFVYIDSVIDDWSEVEKTKFVFYINIRKNSINLIVIKLRKIYNIT